MLGNHAVFSQVADSTTVDSTVTFDTLYMDGDDLDSPILYSAYDSIYADLRTNIVHLYGNAVVDNGEVKLTSGYMAIDLDQGEVMAEYGYDEDSVRTQYPVFTDGSEEILAERVRYNFNTQKAFIEEVDIQQDEIFLHMGKAKRQTNEEIHFRQGRFTTCNLDEPHYHFHLTKAILVPEKRIVSGPMNLWLQGVPTPLGLPFALIPQSEEKTKGFVMPQIIPTSNYGFGFQDLGYFIPLNDRFQTTFYGTLYSRGSFGVRNSTQYAKRYKYKGDFNVGYQRFNNGFPDERISNKTSIAWIHNQDPKANPYWKFNTNVNFISDNETKNNLEIDNDDYFSNTLKSDINIDRSFPGKPVTMGAKLSLSQNSQTENITLISPVVNANVTSFYPLKKASFGGDGLTELMNRLAITYNFEGRNEATFKDTLLRDGDFQAIQDQFINGINQSASIRTTAGLFKNTWKLTPSVTYGNTVNFQQSEKVYYQAEDSIATETKPWTGMSQSLNLQASATTVLYSYYKYAGKRNTILRHVLTPSFSYSFRPNLNVNDTLFYNSNADTLIYSPFEQSAYRTSTTRDQSIVSFGFNNTFELKQDDKNDTVTGSRKIMLVDALSIKGSYDFEDIETPLSDITLNMRVSPLDWLNFVSSANFSPYAWDDSTGQTLTDYAIRSNQGLGRFTRAEFTTTITLTSKEGRERLKNAADNIGEYWNADYEYYILHPEQFLDFTIPWKVSLSHVYSLSSNQSISSSNSNRYNQIQTLMLNADVSFTKRWKLGTRTNFDLEGFKVTNSMITLSRNMHCWALDFRWTPIGTNQSFMLTIRNTSALFQDAKIDLQRPPSFL